MKTNEMWNLIFHQESHELFRHAFVTHISLRVKRSTTMHLFDGVYYYISPSFSSQRTSELSHALDINGATHAQSLDDKALTHFITNSNRFERWQDVVTREEAGELSVVTVRVISIRL